MNMRQYALIIITMCLMACGGGENKNVKKGTSASKDIEKDLETAPEQGGYGFEDLADKLGCEKEVILNPFLFSKFNTFMLVSFGFP